MKASLDMLWSTCEWRKNYGTNGNTCSNNVAPQSDGIFIIFVFVFDFFSCIFAMTDLTEDKLNMEYINAGLMFPRNRDVDGKVILVLKSKLHVRGMRDTDQLIRNFIYYVERLNR